MSVVHTVQILGGGETERREPTTPQPSSGGATADMSTHEPCGGPRHLESHVQHSRRGRCGSATLLCHVGSATAAVPRRRCLGGGVSAGRRLRRATRCRRTTAETAPAYLPPSTSPAWQPTSPARPPPQHGHCSCPRATPLAPRPSTTPTSHSGGQTHTHCAVTGSSARAVGLIGESKTVRPTRPRRPAWHPVRPLLVSSDPIGESEARAWHVVRAVEDELDGGLIPILEVRQELGGE